MIIVDSKEYIKMTTQHDHAIFAGEMAKYFSENLFMEEQYKESVLIAIREHDRAWIGLDDIPIWNDQKNVPFSFMDYPLYPKIVMYTKGINEVEKINKYAALICSIHYTSFGHLRDSKHQACINYIQHERKRQKRLMDDLHYPNEEIIQRHFKLLQLCDELSLYVCLNEEGSKKREEHPWYIDGFETLIDNQKFTAQWLSQTEIKIDPFPFTDNFKATLKCKDVSKDLREQIGIHSAYNQTSHTIREYKFVRR
ncbi:DUF3891 family protein [Bacillus solitudinis]|uniref:DUF3891 family protein n=1 Tax=Bacillus solitudinis TaxID=2014074 RepID=UPI000C25168A|nr:DUF3891 family protein [Bacillus solitudinis]